MASMLLGDSVSTVPICKDVTLKDLNTMERRDFLGWVGTGAIASFLPVAIAACGPAPTTGETTADAPADTPGADVPAADGRINMGTTADLDEKGFLYSKSDNIIVVKNDDGSLSALNPKCTHQQCPVEWEASSSTLTCPCHGSAFATDGSVITGPATESLANYAQVVDEGGTVFVTAG